MTGRPRILAIMPHPDDEAFFVGGTLAAYAARAELHLLVISHGETGKRATRDASGAVTGAARPAPDELAQLVRDRQRECLASARVLGVAHVELLGLPDGEPGAALIPLLEARLAAIDPTVVISLNEAGTTMHPDHVWSALATHRAVVAWISRACGGLPVDGALACRPPFAFRRYFTFTLPEAAAAFDYWGELVTAPDALTTIDVRAQHARKRAAAQAYATQAHWLAYFDRVGIQALTVERYLERIAIGGSARGGDDLLPAAGDDGLALRIDAMPGPAAAYTSSRAGFHAELLARAEQAARAEAELARPAGVRAVILASGKGTRMQNPALPKSLEPLAGKPLIRHIVDTLRHAGADDRPVIVIGPRGDQIVRALGPAFAYVDQGEPRGTGHAVACCRATLADAGADHVLVVYGDMPMVEPRTLRALVACHLARRPAITMGTVALADFDGWRAAFARYGRILRGADGAVRTIREYRDASDGERAIREVNPSLFCFEAAWLWRALDRIGADNAAGERYLTDVVAIACGDGAAIETVAVAAEEALGTNTRADLQLAEQLLARRAPLEAAS